MSATISPNDSHRKEYSVLCCWDCNKVTEFFAHMEICGSEPPKQKNRKRNSTLTRVFFSTTVLNVQLSALFSKHFWSGAQRSRPLSPAAFIYSIFDNKVLANVLGNEPRGQSPQFLYNDREVGARDIRDWIQAPFLPQSHVCALHCGLVHWPLSSSL